MGAGRRPGKLDLNDKLNDTLMAHDVPVARHKNWSTVRGKFPAMRLTHLPPTEDKLSGAMVADVLLSKDHHIVEKFSAIGGDEVGLVDGWRYFNQVMMHVLLCAFCDTAHEAPCMREVDASEFQVGANKWSLFIGPAVARASKNDQPQLPGGFLKGLERALRKAEPEPGRPHWISLYFANVQNKAQVQAALDNKAWPAGQAFLQSLQWAPSRDFYSYRMFVALRPET